MSDGDKELALLFIVGMTLGIAVAEVITVIVWVTR